MRSRSPNGSSRRASSAPGELAGDHGRDDVAGQPPLGVARDAPPQQLERDDGDGLMQHEPVELGQAAAVLDGDEPRLRRGPVGAAGRGPADHGQRERAAVQLARRRVPAPAAGPGALAHLRRRLGQRGVRQRHGAGGARERLAARVEDDRRAPDQAGERGRDTLQPLLREHDLLQPLVRRQRALQDRVLLVDQVGERLLGDRDERRLVRHLDEREAELLGRRAQLAGRLGVGEPGAEPEAREVVRRQVLHERALAARIGQVHPGGEQQLAAREPRGRVVELGDVHPSDGAVEPLLAGDEADVEVADQVAQREHGR